MSDYNWHCAIEDCPLHPIYREKQKQILEQLKRKKEAEAQPQHNHSHTIDSNGIYIAQTVSNGAFMSANWSIAPLDSYSADETMTIKTPYLDNAVPIECFMCTHLNKVDMRSKIIVYEAKKALKED